MAKFVDFFKVVQPRVGTTTMTDSQALGDQGVYANYTWYQRLIQGSASRITRYREYDLMDNDVEVARALDTIAEEMTGSNPQVEMPIELYVKQEKEEFIPPSIVMTLKSALRYWCDLHDWETRLFKVARTTIKYGDCFFLRKSDTRKWEYLHPKNVVAAIVDENDMTRVLGWQIKQEIKTPNSPYNSPVGHFGKYAETQVDTFTADEIVWFTLNDDIGESAPFGESVLRAIYRAQKQKELLEDAIIIYRIQRAPERRVFYIDVGKMPPQRVKTYLEQIKNEIRQKKIPTYGGGVEQVDSVYNPHCLALDTQIPLLDGRHLTLQEIIGEFEQGKTNWAYSINPKTGEVVPGEISWAGITRRNTTVVKLTFDNGETLVCTPDHKIPVQGGGYKLAKDLTQEDSLFPFTLRQNAIRNQLTYTQVYQPGAKKWEYVHKMVGNYIKTKGRHVEFVFDEQLSVEKKQTLHHVDFNRYNNNPENLVFMNFVDHRRYHNSHYEQGKLSRETGRKAFRERLNADPDLKRQFVASHGKTLSERMKVDLALREKFVKNIRSKPTPLKNQSLVFTNEMFDIVKNVIMQKPTISLDQLIETVNQPGCEFLQSYADANKKQQQKSLMVKIKTDVFSKRSLRIMMQQYGYQSFKVFRTSIIQNNIEAQTIQTSSLMNETISLITKVSPHNFAIVNYLKQNPDVWKQYASAYNKTFDTEINIPDAHMFEGVAHHYNYRSFKHLVSELSNFNHKIVSIEWLPEKVDTGTITIDGHHKLHDYHNFAISAGIWVLNSMNEDFFFAQRPEGKGSKVEVLPGGQGLGELADLEYFQWKVFRGLRIPLSYMREGTDNAVITDGAVGVAYIQELRFALFIRRLQRYVEKVMDKEFKRYLHAAGIHAETSMFSLRLPDPENFGIYRQQKLDSELLNTMSTAMSITWLSARFAGKKYLQLSDAEQLENYYKKCEELQLNPDDPASMVKVYGPQPEPGAEAGMGGLGGGGGMFPGALPAGGGLGDLGGAPGGAPGTEPGGLGGETGAPPAGGPAGIGTPPAGQTPELAGGMPPPA